MKGGNQLKTHIYIYITFLYYIGYARVKLGRGRGNPFPTCELKSNSNNNNNNSWDSWPSFPTLVGTCYTLALACSLSLRTSRGSGKVLSICLFVCHPKVWFVLVASWTKRKALILMKSSKRWTYYEYILDYKKHVTVTKHTSSTYIINIIYNTPNSGNMTCFLPKSSNLYTFQGPPKKDTPPKSSTGGTWKFVQNS